MSRPVDERAWHFGREKLFVGAVILCQCLLLAHAVYTAWFEYSAQAAVTAGQNVASSASTTSQPVLYAPDAYRVGMPFLGGIEARLLHLRDSTWIAALNDFGFAAAALSLLYGLIQKADYSSSFHPARTSRSSSALRSLCSARRACCVNRAAVMHVRISRPVLVYSRSREACRPTFSSFASLT